MKNVLISLTLFFLVKTGFVNAETAFFEPIFPIFNCVDEDGVQLEINVITNSPRAGYEARASKGLSYHGSYLELGSNEQKSYTFFLESDLAASINNDPSQSLEVHLSADINQRIAKGEYKETTSSGEQTTGYVNCSVTLRKL